MNVFDPISCTALNTSECVVLDTGDVWLVEGLNGWFGVEPTTAKSFKLSDATMQEQFEYRQHIQESEDVFTNCQSEPDNVVESMYDKHVLKAVFVAGSGGAGKGRVVKTAFAGEGLKIINQDDHLERFLRSAKIPLKDAGKHYGLFRKARDLRNKELKHYANQRLGLVIDSTGWDYERIAKPVKKLRELGYDVSMIFVDVSLKTALRRNIDRANKGGRDVPDSYIADAQRGARRNMRRYMKLFGNGNFYYVDNDADIPDAKWDATIGNEVKKYGRKILSKKIRNAKGRAWLKNQEKGEPPEKLSKKLTREFQKFLKTHDGFGSNMVTQ